MHKRRRPPREATLVVHRALAKRFGRYDSTAINCAMPIFGVPAKTRGIDSALRRARLVGWVYGIRLRRGYGVVEVHRFGSHYRFASFSKGSSGSVLIPHLRNGHTPPPRGRSLLRVLRAPQFDFLGLWYRDRAGDLVKPLGPSPLERSQGWIEWTDAVPHLRKVVDARRGFDDRPVRAQKASTFVLT